MSAQSTDGGGVENPSIVEVADVPGVRLERRGTRRYTAYSTHGGVVEIGEAGTEGTFTPGELLKVALGACAGLSLDIPAGRRLGEDFALTIEVDGGKNLEENRYPNLIETFHFDLTGLDEAAKERMLRVVERAIAQTCTVGRTIEHGATVEARYIVEPD